MVESGAMPWIGWGGLLVTFLGLAFFFYRRGQAIKPLQQEINRLGHLAKELADSRDQLQEQVDNLSGTNWEFDWDSRQLKVSEFILELTGYPRDGFPRNLTQVRGLIHPDDLPQARKTLENYIAGLTKHCAVEMRLKFHDGHFHWVQARALLTRDDSGRPQRIIGSLADISERILAEEERDRLFNLSLDMLAVGGFDGSFHQLNPAWVRALGWSRDDILAEPLLFFIHEDDLEVIHESSRLLKDAEPVRGVESRFRCRDGTYRWLSWSSFPYPDHQLIFSVVRDVTEQKEAETQVLEYQERLRSLSSQLSLVEDRQRQELATAIHDGLAQQLFGIRAQVTLLKFPDKVEDYQGQIQEIMDILDETMRDARNLSFELFPSVLNEVGLDSALIWLAHQFQQRTGLACKVSVEGQEENIPEDLRAMAYQSVRELLNNIYKHAEATDVTITVNHVLGSVTILVEDNGVGFALPLEQSAGANQDTGFGLFSIRERLRSVGGRMRVDSRPGEGCRVILTVPSHS